MILQGPAASGDATQEKFFRTTYLLQRKITLLLSFEEQKTVQHTQQYLGSVNEYYLSKRYTAIDKETS